MREIPSDTVPHSDSEADSSSDARSAAEKEMFDRRPLLLVALGLIAGLVIWFAISIFGGADKRPIRVGVIHSLTGTLADSERRVSYGSLLAVEELNQRGGVLGRPVEAVLGDGASDWPTFARESARLIDEEDVSVLIGCYTSASRKEVKRVVEDRNHLLIYPIAYEGIEQSNNIFYTGATPNQQIIPAVNWAVENLGAKRILMVGSDYIWPHCVHAIVKDQIDAKGLTLVGEHYVHLGPNGSSDRGIAAAAKAAAKEKPDIIINTLVGDGVEKFANALLAEGFTTEQMPSLAFIVTEVELAQLPAGLLEGGYTSCNYFQSIPGRMNDELIQKFKTRFPDVKTVNDGMISAYHSVLLWAQAVEEAGSEDVEVVRRQLLWQSVDSPGGIISIDSSNHHAWREVHIGRFADDASIERIWSSGRPVRPMPFPISRTRRFWRAFVEDLYQEWGQWSNPVETPGLPSEAQR